MRASLFLLSSLLITVFSAGAAQAHGGGLNSEGCHTQRSTGSYHCHRSQAARRSPVTQSPGAFRNCTAARAAGYRNIRRGTYGYGSHLDRDNDGIACEG